VGEETATLLSKRFDYPRGRGSAEDRVAIKDITKILKDLSLEDLQEVPDIGPKVAQSIYDWFREKRNIELLGRLEKAELEVIVPSRSATRGKLTGKTFVITGSLESMSREQAKEKIRAEGGDASESVSAKTSYLVAGEAPGSKFEKAKKLGVTIVNEEGFLRLLK
jgi:DNA ligase (NAD+)